MKSYKLALNLVLLYLTLLFASPAHADFPQDFNNVVWLHSDVSSWKETGVLRSVSTTSGSITLDYDKTNRWPGRTITASAGGSISVNANPWIFVQKGDTWYAATWEWLKTGQTTKSKAAVKGDHIKRAPLNTFVPRQGEIYGFMVSGLARDSRRNVEERTNVVLFRWESEMVPYCTTAPVIEHFSTSEKQVVSPQNIELSWDIKDADKASISPVPGSVSPYGGSINTLVENTTTFKLSATNDCGSVQSTRTVEVQNISSLLTFISALLLDKN